MKMYQVKLSVDGKYYHVSKLTNSWNINILLVEGGHVEGWGWGELS